VKSLARGIARLIFGNEGLTKRLAKMAWVHALAKRLRVREWLNSALSWRPIRRTLPGSGVVYSVETFETIAVEQTYFGNPRMVELFASNPAETFIDLGCNSGIFPCFLADSAPGRAPRGFCVDANPKQVELARKNVALNKWPDVHVFCGLAGSKDPQKPESEFFLAPTSLGSSQFNYQESESGHPLDWKPIVVPTLPVGATWTKLFGPELRCGCLKIDIEGSEMNFLRQEAGFLPRVDTILIEWHIWATTRDEVVHFLSEHCFQLDQTIEDEPRNGLLFFKKREGAKESGE
jgi:FkbM family methyltransferase